MSKQKHFYLIRGLIRETLHWGDFLEHLNTQFPEALVTSIDIPGAGEYFQDITPLSVSKMVEVMHRKFREHRQDETENILVAVSLGGMIAAHWINKYKDDFQSAILINTSFSGFSPLLHRLKPEALLYLLKVPMLAGRAKEAHILKLVSNHTDRFDETLELWDKICQTRPVSLSNTIRQLLAAMLFRAPMIRPSVPIFLIVSINDRMVNPACSRTISERWEAPMIEHPTAGHDITADDPKWVVEKISDFLS